MDRKYYSPDELKPIAQHYHNLGLNVAVLCEREIVDKDDNKKLSLKSPGHKWKHLTHQRQTLDELNSYPTWNDAALPGLGAISGVNNIRTLDIDKCNDLVFMHKLMGLLGLPEDYEWFTQSGSHNGFHLWFVCEHSDNLKDVLTFYPNDAHKGTFDHIELRWRQHTILPPSIHETTGNTYRFVNAKPKSTPTAIDFQTLSDALLTIAEPQKEKPTKATPKKETKTKRANQVKDDWDEVTARFDAWKMAEYIDTHITQDGVMEEHEDGEVRIGRRGDGHGGWWVNVNDGKWTNFLHQSADGQQIGGNCWSSLVAYHELGDINAVNKRQVLEAGARFVGYDLPKRLTPPALTDADVPPMPTNGKNGSNGTAHHEHIRPVDPADFLPMAEEDDDAVVIPQLPDELAELAGDHTFSACRFLTDFENYCRRYFPYAPESFYTLQALTLLSIATAGRAVVKTNSDLYPNLYTLTIGPSGSGKSDVQVFALDILQSAGLGHLVNSKQDHFNKMIYDMGTLPTIDDPKFWEDMEENEQEDFLARCAMRENRLWDFDEMNETIAAMLNKNSNEMKRMEMILSFENPNAVKNFEQNFHANKDRGLGNPKIKLPYLVVTGNAVPKRFSELGKKFENLMHSGFFGRFLIACPPPSFEDQESQSPPHITGEEERFMKRLSVELQQDLAAYNRRLGIPKAAVVEVIPEKEDGTANHNARYYKVTSEQVKPIKIELSKDVYELANAYEAALRKLKRSVPEMVKPLYNRFGRQSLKIAGLFAAYDGSDKVEAHHYAHAMRIAEMSRESFHNLLASNEDHKQSARYLNEKYVVDVFKRNPQAWLSRRDISRRTKLASNEVSVVVDGLIEDGIVAQQLFKPKNGGRPSTRYKVIGKGDPAQIDLNF